MGGQGLNPLATCKASTLKYLILCIIAPDLFVFNEEKFEEDIKDCHSKWKSCSG